MTKFLNGALAALTFAVLAYWLFVHPTERVQRHERAVAEAVKARVIQVVPPARRAIGSNLRKGSWSLYGVGTRVAQRIDPVPATPVTRLWPPGHR